MGSCPRTRCWTIIVSLVCSHLAWADGPSLDEARTAVDNSDYMTARTALDTALHAGGATPSDVAEIYKLSGIVEGALGNAEPAKLAFAKWLELDPKGTLPPGTSPKIAKPFKAASDQAKRVGAIDIKAETTSSPPTVTVEIANDPAKLVASAKVFVSADGKPEETRDGKPGTAIDLPHGRRLDVRIHALDEHGNRVFELGSKSVPLVITGAGDDGVKPPDDHKLVKHAPELRSPRPWYWQHRNWAIAGGAMAVITGFFAYETISDLGELDLLNRNSLNHVWGDAQDVESSAKRNVVIADITGGVTCAFALGALYLYYTRPRLLENAPPVQAVPIPGGATILVGGHF